MHKLARFLLSIIALAAPQLADARRAGPSVRVEITERKPAFGGHSFGERGTYEQIAGKAHMRIDPLAPANRTIVDLALAPRDANGLVAYDIDFIIKRPIDPAKASRVMVYDVVNRGMQTLAMMTGGNPMKPDDPGDGLLMNRGHTLVAAGWQGDIATGGGIMAMAGAMGSGAGNGPMPAIRMLGARFPIATDKGKPITGRVATETIFDNLTGDRMALPYPAAALDAAGASLTVRQRTDDTPVALPASDWRFIDERHIAITRPGSMDAGAIYRFEYTARDPFVMGLGFAATRDFISWLRHAGAAEGNPLADIGSFSSAVAFGASQSGRYLRDFVWRGFNRDTGGRRVFDGVFSLIPGGRQTYTNFRFAEPGRFSRQHEDHDVPGFTFPFAYATVKDPLTGRSDGILRSCTSTGTCPKLFHIDTSGEFWQAGSALVGTGGTQKDITFPDSVRAYMIAGGSHAPGFAMGSKSRYPMNPLIYAPMVRALLPAMVEWTLGRAQPPATIWPRIATGELVPFGALKGPASSTTGLVWPTVINRPQAPSGTSGWPIYVPAIDADGNDKAGIRLPELAAPLGTYLGWNLRKSGYAEGDLCFPEGSFIPFAADAATRGDDPRLSIAERYASPAERAARYRGAAERLVTERFLLAEDAARLIASGK